MDLKKLSTYLVNSNKLYIIFAFLLHFVGISFSSNRWQILLRAHNINVNLVKLLKFYFIGNFFNTFLPTGVGGDIMRMYYISKQTEKSIPSMSTVLIERFTGIFILIFISFFSYMIGFGIEKEKSIGITISSLLALSVIGLIIFFNQKIMKKISFLFNFSFFDKFRNKLQEFYSSILSYKFKTTQIIYVI
ncbi:MAG: lysylphosphatidylglycerol synthase transmembrane domain-containing protein, partial [Acidobacteriota bacterium]